MNRQDLQTKADSLGIELEITGSDGVHNAHIHAYAPEGMKFSHNDTHNVSLFDGLRLNYASAFKVLEQELPLVPCPDMKCEYCYGEVEP